MPVQASTTVVSGIVYNPDGTRAEGALITATNLNTGISNSDTTDFFGIYSIPLSFETTHYVKVVATKGNLYAEKTVPGIIEDTFLQVDLTLQAVAAPTLSPIGLIALISALSAIAAVVIVRKRH